MPGTCLIGHTGFVGGNLAAQSVFDDCYHSRNIQEIRGRSYDLLVCCGVSAVKWKANQFPAEDRAAIDQLLENLAHVKVGRAILISTVDIYPSPNGVDEASDPHGAVNHAYGQNRLYVEDTVRQLFEKVHVARLPGMFGPGLKKNVIYDLLNDNCLDAIHPDSSFQYYDVRRLWQDLQVLLQHDLALVNFATEPLKTQAIVDRRFPGKQIGSQALYAAAYDMRTRYAAHFGGSRGYLYSAEQVLAQLGDWVQQLRDGATA
jgi:hypothetical protein